MDHVKQPDYDWPALVSPQRINPDRHSWWNRPCPLRNEH